MKYCKIQNKVLENNPIDILLLNVKTKTVNIVIGIMFKMSSPGSTAQINWGMLQC